MTLMHRTLTEAMDEIDPTNAAKILYEHRWAAKTEFKLESKLRKELQLYVEILMKAEKEFIEVAKAKHVGPDKLKALEEGPRKRIAEASALVIQIEQLIRKEYGETHHWLE